MSHSRFRICVTLLLTGFLATVGPGFANTVSGRFALGGCSFEPKHVAAFETKDGPMLVFTDRQLEIDLAYAFDPRQSAFEDLSEKGARADMGLVLTFRNGILNYFFFCVDSETGKTSQNSGSRGDATLAEPSDLAGRWTLPAGSDSADPTMGWDLEWKAELADPAAGAEPLRKKGGKPGKAYRSFLGDLAKGDIEAIRRFVNNPYYFKADASPEELDADLEGVRSSMPAKVRVTGGLTDSKAAILEVEGEMTDGAATKQKVLLVRVDGRWTLGGFVSVQ